MKKFLALLLVLCLMAAGCGGSEGEGSTAASGDKETKQRSEYSFTYKGTAACMNDKADAAIQAFGDKYTYFESESCAFKGLDKQYDYGSFVLYTYPKEEVDYISEIDLKDDTVEMAGGVSIGSSEEDVRSQYGEPTEELAAGLKYVDGDAYILFVIDEGSVTSIQLIAITDAVK